MARTGTHPRKTLNRTLAGLAILSLALVAGTTPASAQLALPVDAGLNLGTPLGGIGASADSSQACVNTDLDARGATSALPALPAVPVGVPALPVSPSTQAGACASLDPTNPSLDAGTSAAGISADANAGTSSGGVMDAIKGFFGKIRSLF